MTKPVLLIVDDEMRVCKLIAGIGDGMGYDSRVLSDPVEFKAIFNETRPSVVVMDIVMPQVDGVELVMWLADQDKQPPVILISAYGDTYLQTLDKLGKAKGSNVFASVAKPFDVEELEDVLERALESVQ